MPLSKLKIAMVSPYFFPHTGGTERYVHDLAQGLARRGHEVTVISTNVPPAKQEEQMENILVKRLPALNLLYLPLSKLKREHLAGFDLIHSHAPPLGFTRAVNEMRLSVPHVVTYHCDTTVSGNMLGMPIPGWVTRLVEGGTNRYGSSILPHCDAVITTSESYAKTSPVLQGIPYRAIPIGIFYERFDEALKRVGVTEEARRRNQILFVGRLAANKGIPYLLESIPLVKEVIPEVQYVVVGEGEEKNNITKLVKKLGVANALSFYGKISIETLAHLYASSTVFVLPSINRLEAFGIVQLEAMACRTPVIAADIPGVNSVITEGKSGWLVPPRNAAALAERIIQVLSDFPKSRQMGEYARAEIESCYHWPHICEMVESLYLSLLKS